MKSELSDYVNEVFGTAGHPAVEDLPVIFVAPLGDVVPEDGVFQYTTVDDLSQVGAVKERSVILFREDQNRHLAAFARDAELFARSVQPLYGVPGCNYGVWFDDATFGRERVAYGAFVAELRAAAEVAEQSRAANRSGTKVESDRYTKADGSVRYSNSISVAGDDEDVDE